MIEIISPRKITLKGDISVLEEDIEISDKDRKLDLIPEENIVYPDLVFTLAHNFSKYIRPFVRKGERGLKVVANSLFFKAAREAGFKAIHFDLLLEAGIPLEQIMEEYNLEFPDNQGARDYCQRFLFFKREPSLASIDNKDILLDCRNDTPEFKSRNCIAYKSMVYPGLESLDSQEKNTFIHNEFVAALFNRNGYLRSIDGRRSKSGILGGYID